MKRTKASSLDSNDKHLKPYQKLNAEITFHDSSLSDVGQSKEVSNPFVGRSEGYNSQQTTASDQTFAKSENLSHGKKRRSPFLLVQPGKRGKGVESNRSMVNSARKKGRLTADLKNLEALPKGDLTKIATPDIVEKEHVTQNLHIPVVLGLQCNRVTLLQSKKLKQLPCEKPSNVAEADMQQSGAPLAPKMTADLDGKKTAADTIPRRKRGRPPKSQPISPETSLAVNNQNDKLTGSDNAPKQKNTSKSTMDTPILNVVGLPNKSSGEAINVQQEKYKLVKGKRGKRRTISSINIESLTQDSQDSSKQKADGGLEKDSKIGNPELPIEKSLDTVSDDQPLSKWFRGTHSSAIVDTIVASKKQVETSKSPPTIANGQNLSFSKRSSLWQAIESMELFRTIPQKPHFHPLGSIKESSREGQAISHMVNFSSVVETTSELRFDHPRSAIEELLETLVELESHGFDVTLIRDRLTGLLLIKDKQEDLEMKLNELKDKIKAENVEKWRFGKEIELLDKQVRELLAKRAQVLSMKEKKGSEVAGLEGEIGGIKKGMQEVRIEFDSLAAASWK